MQSPAQQTCDEYCRLAIARTMPQRRSRVKPPVLSLPGETLQRKHSLSPRLPRRKQSNESFLSDIASDCFSLPDEENSRIYDDSSASTVTAPFAIASILCYPHKQAIDEDDITTSDANSLVSADDIAPNYREERWQTPNREVVVFPTTAPRRLPSSSQQRLVRAHSCNATSNRNNVHLRRDCFPVRPTRLRSTSQLLVFTRRPTSFSGMTGGFIEKRTN